jgi:hypothetical protein
VVVRVDPARHRRRRLLFSLLVAAALLASFFLGYRLPAPVGDRQAAADLQPQMETLRRQNAELAQRLANAETGARVDREALVPLRLTLLQRERAIAGLREQVALYRGLLQSPDSQRGLAVRSWSVGEGAAPRQFHYRLVVQHLANQQPSVTGSAAVALIGRDAGGERSLPLPGIELRFRYFQVIEGELTLPEGFTPQRVQVVASTTQPAAARVERRFDWAVEPSAGPGAFVME